MQDNTHPIQTSPEEAIAEFINRLAWVAFACASMGIVVLLELLFLHH